MGLNSKIVVFLGPGEVLRMDLCMLKTANSQYSNIPYGFVFNVDGVYIEFRRMSITIMC